MNFKGSKCPPFYPPIHLTHQIPPIVISELKEQQLHDETRRNKRLLVSGRTTVLNEQRHGTSPVQVTICYTVYNIMHVAYVWMIFYTICAHTLNH